MGDELAQKINNPANCIQSMLEIRCFGDYELKAKLVIFFKRFFANTKRIEEYLRSAYFKERE